MSNFDLPSFGRQNEIETHFDEGLVHPDRDRLLKNSQAVIDLIDDVAPAVEPPRRVGRVVVVNAIDPRVFTRRDEESEPTDTFAAAG